MLDLLVRMLQVDFWARKFKGMNNVVILLYHSPQTNIFELHLEYLHRNYNFISLVQLVDAIHKKDWDSIPKNAIVITFDDGHISNYKLLELFKQYKIKPTIYLVSGIICTNNKFWWQEELGSVEKQPLKYLANKERLKVIEDNKIESQRINNSPVALTGAQIREMSPFVDFQSHTHNHPIITMLDEDELEVELKSPIKILRNHNLEVNHFAYPNGDYGIREIKYLKRCGYLSARTTDIGWNNISTDPFLLKVMGISDNASIPKLRLQISGIFGWVLHILISKNIFGRKKIISKGRYNGQ